jgi:hypothetical protein
MTFQENLLWPDIIDARAWYWAMARWLRNTAVECILSIGKKSYFLKGH